MLCPGPCLTIRYRLSMSLCYKQIIYCSYCQLTVISDVWERIILLFYIIKTVLFEFQRKTGFHWVWIKHMSVDQNCIWKAWLVYLNFRVKFLKKKQLFINTGCGVICLFVKKPTSKTKISVSQCNSNMYRINYNYNIKFGLLKFLSCYRKFHLNSQKDYSRKTISLQTGYNSVQMPHPDVYFDITFMGWTFPSITLKAPRGQFGHKMDLFFFQVF